MQRVVERPRQTVRRPASRRSKDERSVQIGLHDLLELCADYDRRIMEISRLICETGCDDVDLNRRINGLARQQGECRDRIRGVIRCMMGWRY